MTISASIKLGAKFKAVVRDSKTQKIKSESAWTHNLVLNKGLDRMSQGTWVDRCCVGTGTAEPLVTDIGLTNFLAASTNRIAFFGANNLSGEVYFSYVRATYRFGEGAAQGTISEVGLGWNNANLWNKVLLKDVNGDPKPIIVLADEFLDIIVEVRCYTQIDNPTGIINLLDKNDNIVSSHNYIVEEYFNSNFNGWSLGLQVTANSEVYTGNIINKTTPPTGNILGNTGNHIYPTNRSILKNIFASLTQANSPHRTLLVALRNLLKAYTSPWTENGFQIQFDPPIPKSNTQELQHQVLISWDRL